MKKALIIICVVLISLMLASVVFNLISITHTNAHEQYSKIIFNNWNVILPNQYKEIYAVESDASIQGDGDRYHVFQFSSDKKISQCVKWKTNSANMTFDLVGIYDQLKISAKNRPDFKQQYIYYTKKRPDSSQLDMFYFIDTKKLYIYENIL